MNILHVILFSALMCTFVTHYIDSKNMKLSIRIIMAISIYIAGLSVFEGYQFNYSFLNIQFSNYLPLAITPFKWLCFLIPTVLLVYQYSKALFFNATENKKNEKQDYKLPLDFILIISLVLLLTESFFIYAISLELMALLLAPVLINSIDHVEGFKKYQLTFYPCVLLMGVFAVFYSGHNSLPYLMTFPLREIINVSAGFQEIEGVYVAFFVIFYFVFRWIVLFKMIFNSIDHTRNTIIVLPVLMSLFVMGYVAYIKEILVANVLFNNVGIILFPLMFLGIMSFNEKQERPGIEFVKKAFQLILLLVISTTMNSVTIMPSFYIAVSILMLTMVFVSIHYLELRPLAILNELQDRGPKSLFLVIALGVIILTLSPTPLTPVVFALFENVRQIFIDEKVASLLIVLVFCLITFPLIYKIKYHADYHYSGSNISINLTGIIFLFGYIVISFGLIGF